MVNRIIRGPAWWWRRRSLRARLTLITAAGLAVALGAAAILLVHALQVSLVSGLNDSARQGALEVAALVEQNRLPDPVPVTAGTVTIQVLDAQGRIADVSPGGDRLVPLLPRAQAAAAARTGQARTLAGPPLGLPSLLQVVAVPAGDRQIVIAAVSSAQAADSVTTLAWSWPSAPRCFSACWPWLSGWSPGIRCGRSPSCAGGQPR